MQVVCASPPIAPMQLACGDSQKIFKLCSTYELVHQQSEQVVLLLRLLRKKLIEVTGHLCSCKRQGVVCVGLESPEDIKEPLLEPSFKGPEHKVLVAGLPLLVLGQLAFRLLEISHVSQSRLVRKPDELAVGRQTLMLEPIDHTLHSLGGLLS